MDENEEAIARIHRNEFLNGGELSFVDAPYPTPADCYLIVGTGNGRNCYVECCVEP